MELLTTKAVDSFLDVTFIGLVFLGLLIFFTRRYALKKGKTPMFAGWRIFYAIVGVIAFGFFQAVGFNLGWLVLDIYVIKCMWDDYKFSRQASQWVAEHNAHTKRKS
ncbi:hypothetical protein D3C71_78770 [compost metagenome]